MAEINAVIKGHNEKLQNEAQLRAMIAYKQASLTAIATWDSKAFPANVNKAFPNLFECVNVKGELKQTDWQTVKARLMRYKRK